MIIYMQLVFGGTYPAFLANSMIGYISAREMLPMEEVADEDGDEEEAEPAIKEFYGMEEKE